jgi:hypothetical protein
MVQENQVGLKLKGTYHLLVFAGDSINIMKKNTLTLIDASNVVGLEVNIEETKYMLLSHHQNAGQNHDIKICNICFENVSQFRYLGRTITNEN